jgi:hypothetical protein
MFSYGSEITSLNRYKTSCEVLRKIFSKDIATEIIKYLEDPIMKWQRSTYRCVMDEFKSFKKDKNRKVKLRKIVSFAKTKKQWTISRTIVPMIKRYWQKVAAGAYPNKRYRPSVMTRHLLILQNQEKTISFPDGKILEFWTMDQD